MTGPVIPIPSESRWKASESKRVASVMRRRKGLPDNSVDAADEGGGNKKCAKPATTMFDQVRQCRAPT